MFDQQLLRQRSNAWGAAMEAFQLPTWQELPPLELYMDQVLLLLRQYLGPLLADQGDKAITASIINNYVRLKIIPPPVKKKYSRTHLAYLLMICTLKQSLSIASIQALLPAQADEATVQQLYDGFAAQFRSICAQMAHFAHHPEGSPLAGSGHPAAAAAIAAVLTKTLTEQLLQPEEEPD